MKSKRFKAGISRMKVPDIYDNVAEPDAREDDYIKSINVIRENDSGTYCRDAQKYSL